MILVACRCTYEMGKSKTITAILGSISPKFRTPANALLFNMVVGILALLSGKTGEIITISVFGALTLYIISMFSLIKLRRKEPSLERPFKVPLYPVFPLVALVIALVSFIAMGIYNVKLCIIYCSVLILAYVLFKLFKPKESYEQSGNI
jgi:ethanolamine permease